MIELTEMIPGAGASDVQLAPAKARIFNFDVQGIRVVGDRRAPLFVAKDVCAVLEIGHHHHALASLEDYEKGCRVLVDTLGGSQEMTTITEAGLYALVLRSRKPQARLFRRWLFTEVLPAIRRTGTYSLGKGGGVLLHPLCGTDDGGDRRRGAPEKWSDDQFLQCFSENPMSFAAAHRTVKATLGMSKTACLKRLRRLVESGKMRKDEIGYVRASGIPVQPEQTDVP